MVKIASKQLSQMCRRVGTSYEAGVPTTQIWETESVHGSMGHQRHLREIKDRVAAGDSLAEALRGANGYFPPLACDLVDVGEQTGRLDEVLLNLAEHYEHLVRLRRSFLQTIAWPCFQMAIAILVVGALILILGMIKEGLGVFGLSGPRGFMIYCGLVLLAGGVFTVLVMAVLRGWWGAWPVRVAIRLPVIGKCLQTMAISRLSWTLASTLEAGVDARKSVKMALKSTQNQYYTSHVDEADLMIEKGHHFHEALAKTKLFPDEFLHQLETAEIAGTQSEALTRLSRDYYDRSQAASKMLASIAAYGVWFLLAAVMVWLIFDMFFNLYYGPAVREPLRELGY